jgi:hypothetical protein
MPGAFEPRRPSFLDESAPNPQTKMAPYAYAEEGNYAPAGDAVESWLSSNVSPDFSQRATAPFKAMNRAVRDFVVDPGVEGIKTLTESPQNRSAGDLAMGAFDASGLAPSGLGKAALFALPSIGRLQAAGLRHVDDWGGTNRLREAQSIWDQGGKNADTWEAHGWMQPTEAFGTTALWNKNPDPNSFVFDTFDINPDLKLDDTGVANAGFADIFQLGEQYRAAVEPRMLNTPTTLAIGPDKPFQARVLPEYRYSGTGARVPSNAREVRPKDIFVSSRNPEIARETGFHEFDHAQRMWDHPQSFNMGTYEGHAYDAPVNDKFARMLEDSQGAYEALLARKGEVPYDDIANARAEKAGYERLANTEIPDLVHYYNNYPELITRANTALEKMSPFEVMKTTPTADLAFREDAFTGGYKNYSLGAQFDPDPRSFKRRSTP